MISLFEIKICSIGKYIIRNLGYFLLINVVCILSSFIIFNFALFYSNFPRDNWSYTGNHISIIESFYKSLLLYIFIIIITTLIASVIIYIQEKNLNKYIHHFLFLKLDSLNLLNIKYFNLLLVLYLITIVLARNLNIAIVYNTELYLGYYFRDVIYYSYRIIFIFLIYIFILKLPAINFFYIIVAIITFSMITNSRIQVVILGLPLLYRYYKINNKFITHKFLIYIILGLFFATFITFFRGYYNFEVLNFPNKSFIEIIVSTLFDIINAVGTSITYYDLSLTLLSRISSHVDFLLSYEWKISNENIFNQLNFMFFGYADYKTYSYSDEMIALFKFKPSSVGSMAGLSFPGILLSLYYSNNYSLILIIIYLGATLCIFNIFTTFINLNLSIDVYQKNLICSFLFINMFWVAPRLVIFLILVYFLIITIYFVFKKNNI